MTALLVDPTAVLGKFAVALFGSGVLVVPCTKLYTNCGPDPVPVREKAALSINSCALIGPGVAGLKVRVNVSVAPGVKAAIGSGGRKLFTVKPAPTTEIAFTDPAEFPVFVT